MRAHVGRKAALARERLSAYVAREGLLSRVRAHVVRKVALGLEPLAALLAAVAFPGLTFLLSVRWSRIFLVVILLLSIIKQITDDRSVRLSNMLTPFQQWSLWRRLSAA